MIKLIGIDIDGTLLSSKKTILDSTKQIIDECIKSGIKIAICTGRPYRGCMEQIEELKLDKSENYVFSNNGATVLRADNAQKILVHNTLSIKDVYNIMPLIEEYDLQMSIYTATDVYGIGKEANYGLLKDSIALKMKANMLEVNELPEGLMVERINVTGEPKEVDLFEKNLPLWVSKRYYNVRNVGINYEFTDPNANKGSAISELANKLGVTMDEVMVIGDGNNDITMLQVSGISVAMNNASDIVKSYAKYITSDNDSDGIYKAIKKFVIFE